MFRSDDGSCESNGAGDSLAPPQTSVARVPNTPEILNALISINPMDTFMSQQAGANSPTDDADDCSVASSSLDSPASPPNPLNMRTQLIKEDLKMRLRERRLRNREDQPQQLQQQQPQVRHREPSQRQPFEARYSSSGCDESSLDTEEDEGNLSNGDANSNSCQLTPEDEERRKRRRERNKLAAMKCRQKKREQTDKLEHESVSLENQNEKMKTNIQQLEDELRNLKMILQTHKPMCVNPSPEPTPVSDPAHPPSFLSTCSKVASSGIIATRPATNQRTGGNVVAQQLLSPLDLPEFLLSTAATTEDVFTKNLAHLPQQGFLFG